MVNVLVHSLETESLSAEILKTWRSVTPSAIIFSVDEVSDTSSFDTLPSPPGFAILIASYNCAVSLGVFLSNTSLKFFLRFGIEKLFCACVIPAATDNGDLKKVLLDIAREEKTHMGEFQTLLLCLDNQQVEELEAGR